MSWAAGRTEGAEELTLAAGQWLGEGTGTREANTAAAGRREGGRREGGRRVLPRAWLGPRVSLEPTFRKSTSSLSGVVPCCLPLTRADTASGCWEGAIHLQHSGLAAPHQQLPDHTRSAGTLGPVGGTQPLDVQASIELEVLSVEQL